MTKSGEFKRNDPLAKNESNTDGSIAKEFYIPKMEEITKTDAAAVRKKYMKLFSTSEATNLSKGLIKI